MHATLSGRQLRYFIVIDVVLIGIAWWWLATRSAPLPSELEGFAFGGVTVSSPAFEAGGAMPEKYGCGAADGDSDGNVGISPPLRLGGVPNSARSVVLTMTDPDAPFADFTHWFVWNLPPQLMTLDEGTLPSGVTIGPNGAGEMAYRGPCPPVGTTHRYFIKVYALDVVPIYDENTDLRTLLEAVEPNVVGRGATHATYRR